MDRWAESSVNLFRFAGMLCGSTMTFFDLLWATFSWLAFQFLRMLAFFLTYLHVHFLFDLNSSKYDYTGIIPANPMKAIEILFITLEKR
jgi:hypothetical protein